MKINKNAKSVKTSVVQGISSKSVVAAKASAKAAKGGVVGGRKAVNNTDAIAVKGKTFKAWSTKTITLGLRMNGLDGALAWIGTQINDKLCNSLVEGAAKLNASKIGAFDKVLVIDARAVFGWKVSVSGDVYARKDGLLTVRGSISALRAAYGAGNVALVGTSDAASKLHKNKKWDKDCALALGVK